MNEKLLQELIDLGLSEYEAKIYLILALKGPLTAFEISEAINIPYSKVYEAIKKLKLKTIIEISFEGKHKKFKAVESMTAIEKIIKQKEENLNRLKNRAKEISLLIEKQRISSVPEGKVWISEGTREFLERVSIMLKKANSYAYGITMKFSRISELDEEIIKAAKKGVKIKLLGIGRFDELSLARAQWYVSHNIEVRMTELGIQPRVCLIDGKEVCMRIDNPNDSEFIWSDNQALVNFVKSYFDVLWKNAKEFKPEQKIL